jgi:hypothetical protein
MREEGLPKVIGRGMITHRISSLSLKGYGGENDKKPVPAQT